MDMKYINSMVTYGDELVKAFAEDTDALDVELITTKSEAIWVIKYYMIKLEFVYKKSNDLDYPLSTLYTRIYMSKNISFFYHIPELVMYLDKQDFRCYYYTYIESKERFKACIEELLEFYRNHLDKLQKIAGSEEILAKLKSRKLEEMYRIYSRHLGGKRLDEKVLGILEEESISEINQKDEDIEDSDEKKQSKEKLEAVEGDCIGYEESVLLREFTSDTGYGDYLGGRYDKAHEYYIRKIKKKTITQYERRLVKFIDNILEQTQPYEPIKKECYAFSDYKRYQEKVEDKSVFVQLIVIIDIIVGTLITAILLVVNSAQASGTKYFFGTPSIMGYLLGLIVAIYGAFVFQRRVIDSRCIDDYNLLKRFDRLTNTYALQILSNVIFAIVTVIIVVVAMSVTITNTKVFKDRIVFNTGEQFLDFKGTTGYYKDIDKIYYTEGISDDYGDFISRPSYVIVFDDGVVWDSDSFTDVETVEEKMLPLIQDIYTEEIGKIRDRFVVVQ